MKLEVAVAVARSLGEPILVVWFIKDAMFSAARQLWLIPEYAAYRPRVNEDGQVWLAGRWFDTTELHTDIGAGNLRTGPVSKIEVSEKVWHMLMEDTWGTGWQDFDHDSYCK